MKGKGKPIGKGHKGQHRRFTDFEEIEAQQKRLAKQAEWRRQRGDDDDDDDEDENEEESGSEEESDEEESEEEESGEETESKPKGVESLIEVHNPNRVIKKPPPEVSKDAASSISNSVASAAPTTSVKTEMSRREREEAERQRKAASVNLKSEQARADLARLALIKQQREAAQKKREAEQKAKEAAKQKANQ